MVEIYIEKSENPKSAAYPMVLKIAEEKLGHRPEITRDGNGKPRIVGLNFNLSHSGEYLAIAFAEGEVGIDIEKIRPGKIKVAKRFFHPEEVAAIESASDKDAEFFKIWTMKEAYLKCRGVGLSGGLKTFNVLDVPNIHTKISGGYVLSVCTSENEEVDGF